MMDKLTIKKKRQEILRKIDQLESQRCEECASGAASSEQILCGCHAATKIRKLGEEYSDLNHVNNQLKVENLHKELKRKGLSPELYLRMREAGIKIKDIIQQLNWSRSMFTEWQIENGFHKTQKELPKPVVAELVKETITLEAYLDSKRLGFSDKEIRGRYGMSEPALFNFKKENGLNAPRGKYVRHETVSGVRK